MSDDIAAAISNLRTFRAKAETDGEKRVAATLLVIARAAKLLCPVDEGALRADISVGLQSIDGMTVGTVYNTLEYAPWVHQGTGVRALEGKGRQDWPGIRPQPYIVTAFTSNISTISRIMGRPA